MSTTTSKPLKPKRGTTAQNNGYTGEAYEVTLDTDKKTLVVHDGLTAGGFPLARADEVAQKDAEQDVAIAEAQSSADAAQSSADAAQSTANSALEKATNITVPVTSVNGQTGAVTVGTVRSVNGVAADAAGGVNIPLMPDYSAAVIIASGWVAPYNCIGYAQVSWLDNMNAVVTVNGVRVYAQKGAGNFSPVGTQWIVPKGATVTFTGSFEVTPRVFPLKGV
jgi:hypothetical protein